MSFKKIKKQPAFSLSLCVVLPLCACRGDGADVNDPLSDSAQPAHSDTVLSDASDTERVEPATEYPSLALDISGSQYKNNGHHHSALPRRHRGGLSDLAQSYRRRTYTADRSLFKGLSHVCLGRRRKMLPVFRLGGIYAPV